MKHLTVLSASALLGLTACNPSNRPLNSGFDPLSPPGSGFGTHQPQEGFRAGNLVRTVMDNAAFFKALPKGEADADKLLLRGTGMKIIRVNGSFLQVELDVSGEVGYVPTVMVESAMPPGETPIYPPLPGTVPAPDPALLPPGGAIPTVIDPSQPGTPLPAPNPAATPLPGAVTPPAAPLPGAVPPPATPDGAGEPSPTPPIQPTEDAAAKPPAP